MSDAEQFDHSVPSGYSADQSGHAHDHAAADQLDHFDGRFGVMPLDMAQERKAALFAVLAGSSATQAAIRRPGLK
jgi:hypothetical protein